MNLILIRKKQNQLHLIFQILIIVMNIFLISMPERKNQVPWFQKIILLLMNSFLLVEIKFQIIKYLKDQISKYLKIKTH